ncbi:DUF262 domain-containing protein [Lysobacter sp. CW239]|uniref:DUF262 domain-containing protein n=1 Tax=Lysobacteraceae TaxID=32033 RepID=UPI000A077DD2|nr:MULTISPECIES: DUF262 domain-containing protein [Lysobacter]QOD90893.1 DUF262 domain-containing protein [Lysobacter sp. CW239]
MDDKLRNKIIEKFARSQDALVLQQSDLSLKSVSDMVASGAIDISPKYQRRERWDNIKESELIESFLLNIPVPPIYLAEDEYGTYSVIDGKQRITAIHKFLNSNLKLTSLKKFTELEDFTFDTLPSPLANALKIRPYLRVVTLLRQSDPDLKHEVFLRLNKAGVALNSQEIRNVAFRGRLNDLLFSLSENQFFSTRLKTTPQSKVYREMTDVQYVLRFFTIREYWSNFPGNMDKAMDAYMQEHQKTSAKEVENLKAIFESSIDFCEKCWGDQAFTNPRSNSRFLQGFYDIEMICFSLLSQNQKKKVLGDPTHAKKALNDLLKSDQDFYLSVTQFTSNPKNVHYRISTYLDRLKGI